MSWLDYLPDFMSPLGMVFYSVIVYIIIIIRTIIRKNTVEKYVDNSLRERIQKSVQENRKKRA
jgi:hypothetical protein